MDTTNGAATNHNSSSSSRSTHTFDMLMNNKTQEIMNIYEEKINKTNNKKLTADPSKLDFHSKKLIHQINAAFDKKLKGSAAYKRKCEEELSNSTPHQ
jgi:hypothetical protein